MEYRVEIKPFKDKFLILVMGGGGVFGAISNHFLSRTSLNGNLNGYVSAFGGTSIGGILSLAYACDITPSFLDTGFDGIGHEIFQYHFWRRVNPRGAKYDTLDLQSAVKKVVNKRYGDLPLPVIIPTLDFKRGRPKIWDNIINDDDCSVDAWRVGVATASAPTYFDPFVNNVDGGLLENIPIMCTVTALKDKYKIPYSKMKVFAIGTGYYKNKDYNIEKVKKWTALGWLDPMLKMLTKGNELMSNKWASKLGFKSYHLFNPVELDDSWEMDDADLINKLKERCEPYVQDFNKRFTKFLGV